LLVNVIVCCKKTGCAKGIPDTFCTGNLRKG